MSKWDQIKEIKGLLAALVSVIGVLIVIGGLLMEWRVSVNVAMALAEQDLATDSKIVSMDTNIATNTRTGEENAEDISDNERRVEQAFAVLMGRPIPVEE